MKRILIFQSLIILLGCLGLWIVGAHYEMGSFAMGGLVVAGNFILLGLGWKLVFDKKLIALSFIIIVSKYAILGVLIYRFLKQPWVQPYWFVAGVASMMMGSLIYGLTLGFFQEQAELTSRREE